MSPIRRLAAVLLATSLFSGTAAAGPVLLTGHDPDFHAQSAGAEGTNTQLFLDSILDFVTGNTYTSGIEKFLWVESRIATPGGHRVGEAGLTTLGLTLGTHYDRANAAELAALDFSGYSAIVVASAFGGLLTRAELDTLNARSADIATFVNAGSGLAAFAQCVGVVCGADLLAGATAPELFGFVPLSGIVTGGVNGPFTVTPTGAAAPFNLQGPWVNSPTHNSFTSTGGLTVLDVDQFGSPVTIAGNVTITGGGFQRVSEPSALVLLGLGVAAIGGFAARRRALR